MEEMVKPMNSEMSDDCALIRLSCGDANALTTDVMRSIADSVEDAGQTARGIMLCGGDKFFSNGVDLEWALSLSRAEIRTMFLELGRVILKLLESPLPIVGVAKGHAIGGAWPCYSPATTAMQPWAVPCLANPKLCLAYQTLTLAINYCALSPAITLPLI